MAKIINIGDSPLANLKTQLNRANAEKEQLQRDLLDAKQKLSTLVSINEMLKLQLNELAGMLTMFQHQLSGMTTNVNNLKNKLPKLDSTIPHE